MDRRDFMKHVGLGAAAAGLAGTVSGTSSAELAPTSIGQLEPRPGPKCGVSDAAFKAFEDLGIRHLSQLDSLPWFGKNDAGEIVLKEEAGLPPLIDVHSHLGWKFGFGRPVDMTRRSEVMYFYDFERDQNVLFEQDHPNDQESEAIVEEGAEALLHTPTRNQTHSGANLSAELDRMRVQNIILLPLELPVSPGQSKISLEAAKADPRFISFGAVHPFPWGPRKEAQLQHQVDTYGIIGIKLHPVFQFIAPDDPNSMRVYEWCAANNIIVLSHAGYTGREPQPMRAKSEPERFAEPLKAFPKLRLVLAHTGIRRIDETLAVARQFEDQVWVDLSGQPAPNIKYILDRYNTEKIMYASDWPFLPLSVMLARTLVATEGCPEVRDNVLHHNAARLLGLA